MKRIFSFILAMTLVSLSSFAGDLLTAAMFHEWDGPGADATITSETTYCEYQINESAASAGNVYGNSSVIANAYADLSAYAKLVLTFTEGTPRLLFNRPTDTSNDYVNITSAAHEYVTVNEDGTWTIDLAAITKAWGYAHLNAMKGANWQNVNITKAELFMPTFEGDYYLYNVEAGAWLGGGNSWGTQASLVKHPQVFTIAEAEGGYTLDSHTYNNATQHFLTAGGYVDGDATAWTISYAEDVNMIFFATKAYTLSVNGNYLGYDGSTTALKADLTEATAATKWILVKKEDFIASFPGATSSNGVDATWMLKDANFSRNNYNANFEPAWTVGGNCTNKNLSGGNYNKYSNNCAESYHSTFDIYQELTDVPNGYYTVTLQGFYRQDGTDNENLPYFYANDEKGSIGLKTGTENSMDQACESFTNGLYQHEPINVMVSNGKLRIGVKNEANANLWVIWDNFEITYNGPIKYPVTKIEKTTALADWTRTFTGEGETGNFELNTWSTEADESEVRTPFIQSWVLGGSGAQLSAMKIQHTPITNLPAGEYKIGLTARAYNEMAGSSTPSGVKFIANGTEVDLSAGQTFTYNNMAGVWDNFVIPAIVGEDGVLDFAIDIYEPNLSWISFKNFEVIYMDPTTPTVTPVTAKQSAATEAAQSLAVQAFNEAPSPATYEAAKAAIAASQASADFYAPYAKAVNSLDEDGAAVFAASEVAAIYDAGTVDESNPTALKAALKAAQKVQLSLGSSYSFVGGTEQSDWTNASGRYLTAVERYSTAAYTGTPEAPTKIMYQTISGLIPGATYEVKYLATANMAWIGAATGANIAQLYANDVTYDIEVIGQTGCTPADYLRTLQAKADANGSLEFGIQNIGTGGNWYVAQFVDLTLLSYPHTDYSVSVKSETEMYYEGYTLEIPEIIASIENDLGCELKDMKIFAVQPDGTYDANYQLGNTDGWRNAEGAWQGWGDNAYFFVKADFTGDLKETYDGYPEDFTAPGFFSIGGFPGNTNLPTSFTATYAFRYGQKEAHLSVTLNYVEVPAPIYALVEDGSQIINVNRVVNKNYTFDVVEYDTDLVCSALGIESVADATVYGLDASYAWTTDNVEWIKNADSKYNGWRDINGNFSGWSANGAVCVQLNSLGDQYENWGKLAICTHDAREPQVTDLPVNAYWVLAANEKAVIVDTQITFVAEETDEATAITSVEKASENGVQVYDLMGRKANTLTRGQIYIVNGKKVILK